MKTNKPEVVAWYTPPTIDTLPVVALNDRSKRGEPLIRLADYQRLQADHERLQAECAHYKNAVAEITTRHSVDRWTNTSSDKELEQYLSDGIAQLEGEHRKQLTRLQAECRIQEALVEALEAVMEFGCGPKSNRGMWALEKADAALTAYREGSEK